MTKPKTKSEPLSDMMLYQMVLTQREMITKLQEVTEELDEYTKQLAACLHKRL